MYSQCIDSQCEKIGEVKDTVSTSTVCGDDLSGNDSFGLLLLQQAQKVVSTIF